MKNEIEKDLRRRGYKLMAGVDEVGRGPLAGPVVAAAVILSEDFDLPGLNDSKELTAEKREDLVVKIKKQAVAWAVAEASAREIDKLNILNASKLAMRRAVKGLGVVPDFVLVDAVALNVTDVAQMAVVKGDSKCASIAAASVVAKVYRDALMCELAEKYPGYGFERHFGYGTVEHYFALEVMGECSAHRKSFKLFRE